MYRLKPCQSIGANRGATVSHRGSTGLTKGHTGGSSPRGLSRWSHGRSRRRPGLPRYLTAIPGVCLKITGDMSRFNTVHPGLVIRGEPRWTVIIPTVHQGCPRCRHDCDTVHHGSSRITNRDGPGPYIGTVRTGLYVLHSSPFLVQLKCRILRSQLIWIYIVCCFHNGTWWGLKGQICRLRVYFNKSQLNWSM